ncbi:MAG: hypothetical protein ACI8XC_002707, partial [Gammaproteobacteria bacterium]
MVANKELICELNWALETVDDHKARWNSPDHRRWGFHNLHENCRYSIKLRSDTMLSLVSQFDQRIAELPEVQRLTAMNIFSGMVVVRGQDILYEKYANNFGPDCPHSIMSISKTHMNLIIGSL